MSEFELQQLLIATPAFQQPTTLFRYGTFAVLFVVTLVLLQRASHARDRQAVA